MKPEELLELDPQLKVVAVSKTDNPQSVSYLEMHQAYSSTAVYDHKIPSESRCGELVAEKCLKFGHWGVVESPQLVLNVCGFPHSVMQQARTHRHLSFTVTSLRYTSEQFTSVKSVEDVESAIYLRPVGDYTSRDGKRYRYSESDRRHDAVIASNLIRHYQNRLDAGFSEEHARSMLPFDFRQNFVMSGNLRAFFHFLDLRLPADAQLEIRAMSELILQVLQEWCPEIAEFYIATRARKSKLSP